MSITINDCTRCVVSKSQNVCVDFVHPSTGLTVWCNKSLAECRDEYPDAEEMNIDDWCAWFGERQRTPIEWVTTTADEFERMLCVLPPAAYGSGGFLVGEPYDHDAINGQPRFQGFRKRGDVFEVSNRPMTRAEWAAQ